MLIWLFGDVQEQKVFLSKPNKASGFIALKKARVRWFLSLDLNDIPINLKEQGKRTFRSITLDGNEIEFSDGFTDLHTESYKNIIAGNGFGLTQARPSIELAYNIRNAEISELKNDFHPYCLNNIQ
jgi:UDP-N-acetyl-2-amino-2-deoxyglucuronate dehydrogenase